MSDEEYDEGIEVGGDNREEKFLKYNYDNIMINLHQIEQHIRDINREDVEGNQFQCVKKHSMMVQGELDEAISHAIVSSPRDVEHLKTLKENIILFRRELNDHTPEENIVYIREIRKGMETTDPEEYDTSDCKACGPAEYMDDNGVIRQKKDRKDVSNRVDSIIEKIDNDKEHIIEESEAIKEEIYEELDDMTEEAHHIPFLPLDPPPIQVDRSVMKKILDPLDIIPEPDN